MKLVIEFSTQGCDEHSRKRLIQHSMQRASSVFARLSDLELERLEEEGDPKVLALLFWDKQEVGEVRKENDR